MGGGRGGMKLLQMLLQGSPCCRQPEMSLEGRSRLSARQRSGQALCESWGWSVGTAEGAGWWEGKATTKEGEGGLAFFREFLWL